MKSLKDLPHDLEDRAFNEAVISYNKLAQEYGQPRVTPENWLTHPFCDAFGQMDRKDIARGWPLRTALVFSEMLNHPENGFFVMLAERRVHAIAEARRADECATELKELRDRYRSDLKCSRR